MKKKLTTTIDFEFNDQLDFNDFNVDMKLKSCKKLKNTKIIEHKRKKTIDASTKLF